MLETLSLGDAGGIIGLIEALDNDETLELIAFPQAFHHAADLVSQIQDLAVVKSAVVEEDELHDWSARSF
jgi:hypothetical protein